MYIGHYCMYVCMLTKSLADTSGADISTLLGGYQCKLTYTDRWRIPQSGSAFHKKVENSPNLTNLAPFVQPLFLCPQDRQRAHTPWLASNFDDQEPHEIFRGPVTTMRAQHVEVLDLQRSPGRGEEEVDLPVVVQQVHTFLRNLFSCEIVGLHLHGGRHRYEARSLGRNDRVIGDDI